MKIRQRGPLEKPAMAAGCLDTDTLTIHTGEQANVQLIKSLRQALATADECLASKFRQKESVDDLVKARAWVVDRLILNAWDNLIPAGEDITLVAVGGFGRGELHPHSDVDLLILLAESQPGEELRGAIEAFVTLLWDAGFYLGHSVRTLEACVSEANKDVATATSLMESRLLSGRKDTMQEMLDATAANQVWSAAEFFDAKFAEQVQRHQQYHDTAYNLEPNIKESPGGLRDIQMIGWVAKRHFNTQSLHTLVERGFLTESELQDQEALLHKLEGQQFQVKDNTAYTALLSEMEHAKEAISACETRILEEMEAIETGRRTLADAESKERDTRANVERDLVEFAERQQKLEAELTALEAERALVGPQLDAKMLAVYERVAARRRPALALVSGEVCEGCRVGIPAQNYLEIIKGERLITCENCKRILLHPDMVQSAGGSPLGSENRSETMV